jgi:hypothetical protein
MDGGEGSLTDDAPPFVDFDHCERELGLQMEQTWLFEASIVNRPGLSNVES